MSEQNRSGKQPGNQIDEVVSGPSQVVIPEAQSEPSPTGFAWGPTFVGPRPDETPEHLANVREQLDRLKNRQS